VVNVERIEGLLRNLREYTDHLRAAAALSQAEFLSDPLKVGGAKYYLEVAIESCLDICNHIIASERWRAPHDYADTFKVMNEHGVFPNDFTKTLRQMARLRNRLVHLYWQVDNTKIYEFITSELGDFDTFVSHILNYLASRQPPAPSQPPRP